MHELVSDLKKIRTQESRTHKFIVKKKSNVGKKKFTLAHHSFLYYKEEKGLQSMIIYTNTTTFKKYILI